MQVLNASESARPLPRGGADMIRGCATSAIQLLTQKTRVSSLAYPG